MSNAASNPCLDCGACCTGFRVSFYWAEAAPDVGGTVPPEYTTPVAPLRVAMKTTDHRPQRCICLAGTVGGPVHCTIYPHRPSPCRDFAYSWQYGTRDDRCDKARAAHGLAPLPDPTVS